MLRILTVTLAGTILLGTGCADSSESDGERSPESEVAAQRFARPTAAAFGCEGARVAIQTRNGQNYLTAVAGGGFGISARATKVDRLEKFRVYDMGFGRVALQAPNGRFVGWGNGQPPQQGQANPADFLLSASAGSPDQRSVFRVTRKKDSDWLYIQTTDGRFVNALNGGGGLVDVAVPFPGENRQFKAVCVDAKAPTDGQTDPDEPAENPDWDGSIDESGWDDSNDSGWDDVSSAGLGG